MNPYRYLHDACAAVKYESIARRCCDCGCWFEPIHPHDQCCDACWEMRELEEEDDANES
jgi:hypothetical protein